MKPKTDRWATALRVFCLIWNDLIRPAMRHFQKLFVVHVSFPAAANAKTPNAICLLLVGLEVLLSLEIA